MANPLQALRGSAPGRRLGALLEGSSKALIMGLLLLLVVLLFSGMWVLSTLNLGSSQQALADIRREQIAASVSESLARIAARQISFAQHSQSLALLGEAFLRLPETDDPAPLQAALEQALREKLQDFAGASGAGLWFEPGLLSLPDTSYASYIVAGIGSANASATLQPVAAGGFHDESWYNQLSDEEGQPGPLRDGQTLWTPVYFLPAAERAVITAASPMFTEAGRLVGMATTDWASEQIIDLVSGSAVTPASFTYLIDRNNRSLTSLSRADDVPRAQRLIDAVISLHLAASITNIADPVLQQRELVVDGEIYELFYAATPAGMVFGAGVPRAEIDAVLAPMQSTNYRILVGTGLVLLLLSAFLLYRIAGLMRQLEASYTDSLTGLPNRARLLQALDGQFDVTLMLINLDRFKEVNSLFGHACGDHVLAALAAYLRKRTPGGGEIYRVQGDEFAVLWAQEPPGGIIKAADAVGARLREHRVDWQGQAMGVDATLGIAQRRAAEAPANAADALLNHATIALRQAREQGRNFLVYNPQAQVEQGYAQNLEWAQRLKRALREGRIIAHYQPIHDNRSGRISKYECLVRMQDASGDIIGAGRFLDIARKLRLDRQITRIMINRCFTTFMQQTCDFSINLSYADLVEPELVDLLVAQLQEGAIGQRVIFELLESDGIENYSEVRAFIDRVKPYGCRIAIDDFGTGYSNFAHLLRLDVDLIKIDGSLICHLHEDETAFKVTQGIVAFARSLGIATVAEFVHCAAVQERVLALGIDFSQGYFFGVPAPGLEIALPAASDDTERTVKPAALDQTLV